MERRGRSNPTGQLLDKYRAEVVSVTHPSGYHMAKVRLLVLWDSILDADLPWAEYQLPLGARSAEGDAMPCCVGDYVWVEFPMSGDSRVPLITGACYTVTDSASDLPEDLFTSTYDHVRGSAEPDGPTADYGDKVLDLFGVLQQLTQSGDWCLTHKSSGTALHIDKDGKMVLHTEGDSYQSSTGSHTVEIGGDYLIGIEGSQSVDIDGSQSVDVDGSQTVNIDGSQTVDVGSSQTVGVGGSQTVGVGGSQTVDIGSALTITVSGNTSISAGGSISLSAGGALSLEAGGELSIKGSKITGSTGSTYEFD